MTRKRKKEKSESPQFFKGQQYIASVCCNISLLKFSHLHSQNARIASEYKIKAFVKEITGISHIDANRHFETSAELWVIYQ